MIIITDNQNEIFDVVDADDNVVGKATRGEVHKNKSLIHRSIGVAVLNKKGEIYLQQRSATKDTDPLCWTLACTGHMNHNIKNQKSKIKNTDKISNIYEEAAARELEEELGITNLELEFVCKYICRAPNETEMQMLYKTFYDGPFKLHPEEIAQGKFFTRKELKEQVEKGKLRFSFMGKVALQKLGWV